jgi:hypothetical protein
MRTTGETNNIRRIHVDTPEERCLPIFDDASTPRSGPTKSLSRIDRKGVQLANLSPLRGSTCGLDPTPYRRLSATSRESAKPVTNRPAKLVDTAPLLQG